ncbi:MAG: PTS sugar transporter subunit IIA [Gammaproteobacteria bacterium]
MSGVLLITHGNIGQDMLDTVCAILGGCPLDTLAIGVANDSDPDAVYAAASQNCASLNDGKGVLVLTDLYGSTPSNIANRLVDDHDVIVVAGVNMPMLLRVMNYPDRELGELAEFATSGARNGIVITRRKQAS